MNCHSLSKRLSTQLAWLNCPQPVSTPTERIRYWTNQTLRLEIAGPDGQQILELNKPFARIGGHPLSDVHLTQPGIKRKQLYLHISENQIYGVDFAESLDKRKRIELSEVAGQTLNCGPYKITPTIKPPLAIQLKKQAAGRDRPSVSNHVNQPYILMPGKKPIKYPISRKITTIGRSLTNKISIANREVSNFQCIIFNAGGELWVVDLFSLNQTRLNNQLVDCAIVPVGGRLQICSVEIVNRLGRKSAKTPRNVNLPATQHIDSQAAENGVQGPKRLGLLVERDLTRSVLTNKLVQAETVMSQLVIQRRELQQDRTTFDELIVRLAGLVRRGQEAFELIKQEHQENCRWLELRQSHLHSQCENLLELRREQHHMMERAVKELKNQWQQLNDEKRKVAEKMAKLDELNVKSITDTRNQQLTNGKPQDVATRPAEQLMEKSPSLDRRQLEQQQKLRIFHNIRKLGRSKY